MKRQSLPAIPADTRGPHQVAREYHAMTTRLRSVARRHGLGDLGWLSMIAMREHHGLPVTRLAEVCGMQQPTMTKILDQLVRKGFVTREQDRQDMRRVLVMLTPEGAGIAAALEADWDALQADQGAPVEALAA